MGLDAAELLMEVEEQFDIRIAEDEFVYFRTLGDLHDCLLEKCAGRRRSDEPVQAALNRLRGPMGRVLGVAPESLRPDTLLLPLLGTWRRQHKWARLQWELGLELPPLENRAGRGVAWGMLIAGSGTFVAVTIATHDGVAACGAALVSLLVGALLGYCAGLLWPHNVDDSFKTVGGLARCLVALNSREFPGPGEPSTENDPVWEKLCGIVIRQLGARRETLRRDTRWVEDLGF